MKQRGTVSVLVTIISILALTATLTGIFSDNGPGRYEYESIRGQIVTIYGKGIYQHMSADVAIQGIAQDYITMLAAIPLLVISLIFSARGSLRSRFILAGMLYYFLVTYLMYLGIAMYNALFLVYVSLIGTSFFALALVLLSFDTYKLPSAFNDKTPVRFAGGFLIFNSIAIALLWLSVVLPPLLDGSVYPGEVNHYTTLTVQGLDLALFLPISFVSGLLLIKKNPFGYLIGTVTLVFLTLLMTALLAKIIAMALSGVNVIPSVFIIPAILAFSLICCILMIKNIKLS